MLQRAGGEIFWKTALITTALMMSSLVDIRPGKVPAKRPSARNERQIVGQTWHRIHLRGVLSTVQDDRSSTEFSCDRMASIKTRDSAKRATSLASSHVNSVREPLLPLRNSAPLPIQSGQCFGPPVHLR